MIGIDTNVLLRLFVRDDEDQVSRAQNAIMEAATIAPVMVNPIVLSEFAWTLSKGFKLPRKMVADHVERVLLADDLNVVFRKSAFQALEAYRTGKADFPDYFLASINRELGCSTTATFDRDALDYDAFIAVA